MSQSIATRGVLCRNTGQGMASRGFLCRGRTAFTAVCDFVTVTVQLVHRCVVKIPELAHSCSVRIQDIINRTVLMKKGK